MSHQPTLDGFDPPAEPVEMGATARQTARKEALLAKGIHPISGAAVADNGETCGSCGHMFRFGHGRGDYLKCDINPTRSARTDVRRKYPACAVWKPNTLGRDRTFMDAKRDFEAERER